jgi:hypothetical protein
MNKKKEEVIEISEKPNYLAMEIDEESGIVRDVEKNEKNEMEIDGGGGKEKTYQELLEESKFSTMLFSHNKYIFTLDYYENLAKVEKKMSGSASTNRYIQNNDDFENYFKTHSTQCQQSFLERMVMLNNNDISNFGLFGVVKDEMLQKKINVGNKTDELILKIAKKNISISNEFLEQIALIEMSVFWIEKLYGIIRETFRIIVNVVERNIVSYKNVKVIEKDKNGKPQNFKDIMDINKIVLDGIVKSLSELNIVNVNESKISQKIGMKELVSKLTTHASNYYDLTSLIKGDKNKYNNLFTKIEFTILDNAIAKYYMYWFKERKEFIKNEYLKQLFIMKYIYDHPMKPSKNDIGKILRFNYFSNNCWINTFAQIVLNFKTELTFKNAFANNLMTVINEYRGRKSFKEVRCLSRACELIWNLVDLKNPEKKNKFEFNSQNEVTNILKYLADSPDEIETLKLTTSKEKDDYVLNEKLERDSKKRKRDEMGGEGKKGQPGVKKRKIQLKMSMRVGNIEDEDRERNILVSITGKIYIVVALAQDTIMDPFDLFLESKYAKSNPFETPPKHVFVEFSIMSVSEIVPILFYFGSSAFNKEVIIYGHKYKLNSIGLFARFHWTSLLLDENSKEKDKPYNFVDCQGSVITYQESYLKKIFTYSRTTKEESGYGLRVKTRSSRKSIETKKDYVYAYDEKPTYPSIFSFELISN